MIDDRVIERMFRVLRAQVPGRHPDLTSDTTSVWLARLRSYPESALMESATTWGAFDFPDLGPFVDHVDQTVRRLNAEDRDRYRDGTLDTVACPECSDGEGWVPEPASQREGYDVPLRPCSKCNPRGFWLWRNGHYAPDHTCRVCRALRKGDTNPLTEAMAKGQRAPIETTATVASEF